MDLSDPVRKHQWWIDETERGSHGILLTKLDLEDVGSLMYLTASRPDLPKDNAMLTNAYARCGSAESGFKRRYVGSASFSEIDWVEELKGIVKIKGVKKEALHSLRQKPGQYICCQNHKLIADIEDDIMDPDHLKMEMEMEIPSSSNVKLISECSDMTYTCYEVMKDLIKVSKLLQTLISYSSSQVHKMAINY
ncbi:hypothetical protein Tco_0981104 [Tanacetum coccineum]